MAKRRKRAGKRRSPRVRTRTVTKTRYRTRAPKRRGRRRRSKGLFGGGGGSRQLVPNKAELTDYAMAAGWGFIERTAKGDANFFLNKVPKPITPIGYTGNVALAMRIANVFLVKNPMLGKAAHVVAGIASYQLARNGGLFTDAKAVPTIAGEDDDIAGELDDEMMGALAAEGEDGIYGDDDDDIAGLVSPEDELEVAGVEYDEPTP